MKINLSHQLEEVAFCNFCTKKPEDWASLSRNFTEIYKLPDCTEVVQLESSETPLRQVRSFHTNKYVPSPQESNFL